MLTLSNNIFNYTMVFVSLSLSVTSDRYHRGKDDWPSGAAADYVLNNVFMDKPSNLKKSRALRFIWAEKTGSYQADNQSWDGAIGLVANSQADAYMMPLDYTAIPEVVEPSSCIHSVDYLMAQTIASEEETLARGFTGLVDLVVPPLEFLIATLCGVLAHIVCVYLFSFLWKKIFKRRKAGQLQIKTLVFFFSLFWFFLDQFYNGNLSTENITVDVSDLLYSEEQLIKTKKESCFFDKDTELNIFKNAPKNTMAYKIYLKLNTSYPCFLETKGGSLTDLLAAKNPDQFFWLGVSVATDFLAKVLQFFGKKDTFINETPVWLSPRALIVRKSLRKAFKDYFNLSLLIYTELGYFTKAFRDFPFSIVLDHSLLDAEGHDLFRHWNSLIDYKEDHSQVATVSFLSLDYFFRIYAGLLSLFFLINMTHFTLVRLTPIRAALLIGSTQLARRMSLLVGRPSF